MSLSLPTDLPSARRWVVAYSGGLDSHVLLHLCASLRESRAELPALVALHIDHAVQPQSRAWAVHCAAVCERLGVAFEMRRVDPGPSPARVSEDLLRQARYRIFEQFCGAGDLLLLAHHRDDQAETVLLRLVRGAGAAGLAGMPRQRPCGAATLYRPLLEVPRQQLRDYAAQHALAPVQDPSNESTDYDRNYLRLRVMPLLEQRWPSVGSRIARAGRSLAQAADICAGRAHEDLRACAATDRFGQACLDLAWLQARGEARSAMVLREWLRSLGVAVPSAASLAVLLREVIGAAADRQPCVVLGPVSIRRYRDKLYALAAAGSAPAADYPIAAGAELTIPGAGRVSLRAGHGGGVRAGGDCAIRFRSPGLRCHPAGRPGKTIKQLAQEHGVPPWLRQRMPLLYVDGKLAAVADLCICEGFQAGPGEKSLSLRWQPGLQ